MLEEIPSYSTSDFKELVVQVFNLTKDRRMCNFLEGDFEHVKKAKDNGGINPYSLRYFILGLSFDQLPLYISKFGGTGKEDKISNQIVRWRLRIGK